MCRLPMSSFLSQFNPGASRCEVDVVDRVCRTCVDPTVAALVPLSVGLFDCLYFI